MQRKDVKFVSTAYLMARITIDILGIFYVGDGEGVPTVLLCGVEPRQLDVIFGHSRTLQMRDLSLCMALA